MDFLNNAWTQVGDLFRTMTPAARITTGLLLSVVVLSLVFLFRFESDSPGDFLFGAEYLSQSELNAMTAALGKAGLNGFQVEDYRIRVPREQRDRYLGALVEAGALPEHPGKAFEEMFRSNSPLESRDVRELKARRAGQRSLASIIREIPSIADAWVEIEDIDKGGFPRQKERRALVSLKGVDSRPLDEQLLRSIRVAVASGGGVESENVTVMDLNSGTSIGGTGPDGKPFGEENPYAAALRRYENLYRDKIQSLLGIPGVRVEVSVDLDKNLARRTATRKFDSQPVAVRSTEFTKDSTTSAPQNQGRPGAASNNVTSNAPLVVSSSSGTESSSNEQRTETNSLAGTTHEFVEQAPLVPTDVKAAIYVPASHFRRLWQEENPVAEGEDPAEPDRAGLKAIETREIQNIEDLVAVVLPEPPPGVDKYPRISVQTYTDPPLPPPSGPSVVETATTWFAGNWQTLGMFVLAVVGVVMLRGMLKAAAASPVAVERETRLPLEGLVEPEEDEEELDDDDANSLKARFQRSGRSLRDELGELVKEDPDAAASVLQNWIGDAA